MEKFKKFEIEAQEVIYGGKHYPTYIGRNGDIYDSETERFILF